MKNFLKELKEFIKKHPGIIYSLALLLFIPLILYYNTYFITKSFQNNIDLIIQNKGILVENIFELFLSDKFKKPEQLQQELNKITREIEGIIDLRILEEADKGQFLIIASQNKEEIGEKITTPSFSVSYSQEQEVAQITHKDNERIWNVISPFYYQGEKVGLISVGISLKESDIFLRETIIKSYFIVIFAIILSLLLIVQHTKLFGYVSLSNKLQEIDKMKDNFIRMATHELQSPIINIRGHLLVLKEDLKNLTPHQENLFYRTDVSAKNLANLINDILEVSRFEQGRLDFSPEKINPTQLVIEVIKELELKIIQKKLEIEQDFPKEPIFIQANSNRFKQIIYNILNNAIKYTPEGKITIKIEKNKPYKFCSISVEDTGLGISAQDQKRMFERFYRVKIKETNDIPGSGLGLWISKQLTEKMNGNIHLESIEKKGSKFTVSFPLLK